MDVAVPAFMPAGLGEYQRRKKTGRNSDEFLPSLLMWSN
jgi:hypothetical protein